MAADDRTKNALRALVAVVDRANDVVAAHRRMPDDVRALAEALAEYESTDAHDFVTDTLESGEMVDHEYRVVLTLPAGEDGVAEGPSAWEIKQAVYRGLHTPVLDEDGVHVEAVL